MRFFNKIIIIFLLLVSCQKKSALDIRSDIQTEFNKVKGEFALAYKDLQTGEQILINEHQRFHAASTMKVPVLIEIYKQASSGNFSLNDSLEIKNEFQSIVDSSGYELDKAEDSDTLIYQHIGEKRTIYSLTYDMIILSSNLATNIVIDKVGASNVQQTIQKLGTRNMQVLRGVEDTKAYRAGLNNTTTAYDLMILFEKIAIGEAVDGASSQEMIKILLDQKFNDIIPAQLPRDVRVAHKTGWITASHHDSGIVFLPDGRKYILILLSKNLEDEKEGVEALARVSKTIYEWVLVQD